LQKQRRRGAIGSSAHSQQNPLLRLHTTKIRRIFQMNMLYFKITFFAINFVNSRYIHYICAEYRCIPINPRKLEIRNNKFFNF
jgi:hypothetical protein